MPAYDATDAIQALQDALPWYGFRAYDVVQVSVPFMGATLQRPALKGRFGQVWYKATEYAQCLCGGATALTCYECDTAYDREPGVCVTCDAIAEREAACLAHLRADSEQRHYSTNRCGIYMLLDPSEILRQWFHGAHYEPLRWEACSTLIPAQAVCYVAADGVRVIGQKGLRSQRTEIINMRLPVPLFSCTGKARLVKQHDEYRWTCGHQYADDAIFIDRATLKHDLASTFGGVRVGYGWPRALLEAQTAE